MSAEKYFLDMIDQAFGQETKDREEAIKQKSPQLQDETTQQPPQQVDEVMPESQEPQPTAETVNTDPIPEQPDQKGLKEQTAQLAGQYYAQSMAPGAYQGAQVQQESDPRNWTPDQTHQNFIDKTKDSLVRGFGKHVIGGTGDIVQLFNPIFGMDIAEGNALSRYLQEQGEIYEKEYGVFMPPEMREPEWNMKTFMNKDFWSGHIAEYIPQLIEFILLSKGAGAAARQGAKALTRQVGKAVGKETVEKVGKKVTKNTTARLGANAAEETIEVAGTGKGLGKLITTAGELTEAGGMASEIVGGGLSMNLLAGMQNAGQLINEYKDSGLYTEDELRDMASGTIMKNMQYLPIDMLSWGITFGQGTGLLGRAGYKIGGKQFTKLNKFWDRQQQLALSGKQFQKAMMPTANMLKRVTKGVGKPLFEGFEETFQETFEEWSQKRAKAEAIGEEYDESYWDFYYSKENEATRAISFALGALAGGGMNIASFINKEAEDQYKLWNRSEMLKKRMVGMGREAEMMQDWHITDQMINNKLEENGISNEQWLQTLFSYGVMDESQLEEKLNIAKAIDENYKKAQAMNIRGKAKFLQEVAKKQFYEQALTIEGQKMAQAMKALQETVGDNPKLLKEKQTDLKESYDLLSKAIRTEIALAQENIENLLSGKRAKASYSVFVKGPDGKISAIGLTQEQLDDYYNKTDEEIFAEIDAQRNAQKKQNSNLFKRLSERGREIFNNLTSKTENEATEDQGEAEATTEQPAQTDLSEFEGITPDEETTELNDDLYQEFDDNGVVPAGVVRSIAQKLMDDPEGGNLSEQERAVRKAKNKAIEKILQEQASQTTPEQTDTPETPDTPNVSEPTYSPKTQKNVSQALGKNFDEAVAELDNIIQGLDLDTTNERTIQAGLVKALESNETLKKLAGKFNKPGAAIEFLSSRVKPGKAFKAGQGSTEKSKPAKGKKIEPKKARSRAQQERNVFEQELANETNKLHSSLRARLYNSNFDQNPLTEEQIDSYLVSAIGKVTYGPQAIDKARHINQHLRVMFPEQKIQVYAMTNLMESIGQNALGYALLASTMIDEKVWNQDEIYMHEMSHIYYNVTQDTPATQNIIKNLIKRNKPFIKRLMDDYWEYVAFEFTNTKGLPADAENIGYGVQFGTKEKFQSALSQKIIKLKPLRNQKYILEEAFVRTLEGPLSAKYNRYFDIKREPRRKTMVRRWWKFIKNAGIKAKKELPTKPMVDSLEEGSFSYGNLNAKILDGFVDAIKGKSITTPGMAMRVLNQGSRNVEREIAIREAWEEEVAEQIEKERIGNQELTGEELIESVRQLNEKFNSNETAEDNQSKNDFEERVADDLEITWDKEFVSLERSMGKIISNFSKKYSNDLFGVDRKAYEAEMKRREEGGELTAENITSKAFINPYREHIFKRQLMQLAKEEPNPWAFIRRIEDSLDPDMQAFMEYMKEIHPEIKLQILRSAHLLYFNSEVVPVIIHNIDKQGYYSANDAFSRTEKGMIDTLRGKMYDNAGIIKSSMHKVMAGDVGAAVDIIQLSSSSAINTQAIKQEGLLIVDKKVMPLVNALQYIVKQNGELDPLVLARAIVNTNRIYSSWSVVKNPKGDNISSRIIGNHLTRLIAKVRQDLLDPRNTITQKEFYTKYGKTALTTSWWNQWSKNKVLPGITMMAGNENKMNDKFRSYSDSTADQELINETLSFIDSINSGSETYLASMDIFGDSKRRYLMGMERIDNLFNENGSLNKAGEALIKQKYKEFVRLSQDNKRDSDNQPEIPSESDFIKAVKKGMDRWVEYFQENAEDLYKVDLFRGAVYNNNKTIKKDGKTLLKSFMLNRMANTISSHETINPGIPLGTVIKRNKGNIAPVLALDPNLRVEMLMWADERIDNNDPDSPLMNDSGQYILEEHALALQQAGKGVINLNYGFKLFSHNVERDTNSPFYGKTHQMKGYTTILSKEAVEPGGKQSRLKPLRDAMVARYEKYMADYKERTGKNYDPTFGTGDEKYMVIVTPVSAEKAHLFNNDQLKKLKEWATIDALSTEEGMNRYMELHDLFYYPEVEGKRTFVGLDGSNLGPQQVMDKEYLRATFSVQANSSLLVGAEGQALEVSLMIQELLADQKAEILQERVLDKMDKSVVDFVLETTNKNEANPLDIINLQMGMMPYHPTMHEFISFHIRKQFINNGNRLRVPGTYGQTISDVGFEWHNPENNQIGYINGSSSLQFYDKTSDDKTIPMDIILPKNQQYDGVRGRELFFGEEARAKTRKRLGKLSKEFGLKTTEDIEKFIDQHVIYDGPAKNSNVIGYYVPGEVVMFTRIPHNGPAFMGMGEVAGFNDTDASSIMVPTEFKNMIGSDDDGDALFVYKTGKDQQGRPDNNKWGKWNKALAMMIDRWSDPEMYSFLTTPLSFEEQTKNIIKEIQDELGTVKDKEFVMPFGLDDYRHNFNNSVIAKQTIGVAFNAHRIINTLSAFEVGLRSRYTKGTGVAPTSITINGRTESGFADFGAGLDSRIHRSTILANIVLDSTKNGHADALNLNLNTIGPAMVLVNLGYDLKTIGLLFNHPAAKDYISRFNNANNDFLDAGTRGQIMRQIRAENSEFDQFGSQPYSVEVIPSEAGDYYNSKKNRAEVVRLLDYLFYINGDINSLSKMLSGHNKIEMNPHSLNKQIEDFKALTSNNRKRQTLSFPDSFAKSKEIQSYLYTAEQYSQKAQEQSVIFNDSIKAVLDKIASQITGGEISHTQLKHFSEKLLPAIYARFIGLNNLGFDTVNNAVEGFNSGPALLAEMAHRLGSEVIIRDPNNRANKETALDHNFLFAQGIDIFTQEDGTYDVTINPEIMDASLTAGLLKELRDEFDNLPEEIQRKLVIYDLVTRGWNKPGSIAPLFSESIQMQINNGARNFQEEQAKIDNRVLEEMFQAVLTLELQGDRNHFPKVWLNQDKESYSKKEIATKLRIHNRSLVSRILGSEPFYIEVRSMSKNGRKLNGKKIFKVNPVSDETLDNIERQLNLDRRNRNITRITAGNNMVAQLAEQELENLIEEVNVIKDEYGPNEVALVAIPDPSVTNTLEFKKKSDDEPGTDVTRYRGGGAPRGMAYRRDFNNFTGKESMSFEEFNDAMQYKVPVPENLKEVRYSQYLRDKQAANNIIDKEYSKSIDKYKEAVSKMSDDELMRLYSKYGEKNIYAYSIVLVPVILELTARASAEQSKLTGRYEDGKDIGVLKSWLQANNINSNHPATQAIARSIETEFKGFLNERKKYIREINKVTEALYAEKLGVKPSKYKLITRFKRAFKALFTNRKKIYETLYGNIVDLRRGEDSLGNPTKAYRLKGKNEIDRLYREGKISQAEFDFANTFRRMTTELHAGGNDFNTGGFVPAVGMNRLEAYANRGLLGVLTNSKTEEEGMGDVRIMYEGQEISYKNLKDIFRNEMGSNFRNVAEFIKIRRKVKKLLREGINEDGTPIQASKVQNLTLLGDGMVNKFANDGYVAEGDLLSLDLNKALTEFVHTSLFVNGNENFQGFTKLQAQVDGLLLHNRMKGFKNQNKFVRKVYKEYFLRGKRLKPETTQDRIIEGLTKLNMLYIMGYKMLLLGKAAYVVGNVVVGKYHNIKNAGGKAWSKGESRYWGLEKGARLGTKKSAGVLETLNFMDINLYDTVNLENSSGLDTLITDIALMPMQWSEKWIQGVQMLGLLSDEQWSKFDQNGQYKEGVEPISNAELAQLENEVKNSHGKGYTPTDQRMIQQYSWGKAMMQFARFIPTMWYDRFGKDEIDIYGRRHIGSLRLVYDVIQRILTGDIPPSEIGKYRANMSPAMRQRFDSGLRGLGITSLAIFAGQAFNLDTANELVGDANYLINADKLEYKMMPSLIRTTHDGISSLIP